MNCPRNREIWLFEGVNLDTSISDIHSRVGY